MENPRIKAEKRVENTLLYFLSKDGILNLERLKSKIDEEFEICEKEGIEYIGYFSKNYPENLKELKDPPFMIFYRGYFPDENELEKSLAIIGSRKPEKKYGQEVAKRMGVLLAQNNWWNISGLALGCDECGHLGSLEGDGKTGAILGQGLGTPIYPKKNRELAERILEKNGFLMSELPPTTSNLSIFFILRNRLQSGMTQGIFVVQTGRSGGTLHTIKYSLMQERKTIIWDPGHIEELKGVDEVLGNKILIEDRKDKLGVSIGGDLRKKILKIKQAKEIYEILNEKSSKKCIIFHNKTLF
ncbi:DNA-processing protein DprA [Psychrilyobacter atlanticus]|uniref:DNA-processing protein DprA n=1 Tax=Psychrilyobacter atlanticus TaxID=271091 RepID=UPI00146EAB2A|nr:DNA-processing protein DprA [Psychrilyobacter atlanticus]